MSVYIVNRLTKAYNEIPYIGYLCKCHLNDFIGGVVFVAYVNILFEKSKYPKLEKCSHICLLMLLCGCFWECVCPIFLTYSTADFLDVISYILGGIVYWLYISRNKVLL